MDISEHEDKEGRFVKMTCKIEGMVTSVMNGFIPPGSLL